ncbi:MAG TPA: Stp1/IreP family PP2C-type Ser/Thr phosphatase [Acidobacteriaceae bacterium]|nr:Stp1/IreP family PP2C-type Ser/Thr phosphatase [Acidobacteriaceae bacterium]
MSTPHANLLQAAAHTSTGRLRTRNEDAFGLRPDRCIFVVCDGMGGAAGGEIASRLAVDTVIDQLLAHAADLAPREALHQAVAAANRAVFDRADSDPGLSGMGTTLVALLFRHGSALIAHAGDSRCYLFRGGHLLRQTHDHSLVDEQIRLGTITAEEAERSPFRSVITRAIGTQPSVSEEILELPVEPRDLFLLCTDGLTREVGEDEIARILTIAAEAANLDPAAWRLVESANEAGGRDNITCLLVRVP